MGKGCQTRFSPLVCAAACSGSKGNVSVPIQKYKGALAAVYISGSSVILHRKGGGAGAKKGSMEFLLLPVYISQLKVAIILPKHYHKPSSESLHRFSFPWKPLHTLYLSPVYVLLGSFLKQQWNVSQLPEKPMASIALSVRVSKLNSCFHFFGYNYHDILQMLSILLYTGTTAKLSVKACSQSTAVF